MSFREFSKLLPIALKSSRNNPQYLYTNFVPFSHKILTIFSHTQSCNNNKLTPICFLLAHLSHSDKVRFCDRSSSVRRREQLS